MNYNDLSPFILLDDTDRYHNALKKAKIEGLDCSDIQKVVAGFSSLDEVLRVTQDQNHEIKGTSDVA